MKIKKTTIRRLRAIASKVFPGDEEYHTWLGQQFKVESTLDLQEWQGIKAINELQPRADVQRKANIHKPMGGNFASVDQKDYINGLFDQLDWKDERQWGFIKKQTGLNKTVDMLTPGQATKVITGLKRMIQTGYPSLHKTKHNVE